MKCKMKWVALAIAAVTFAGACSRSSKDDGENMMRLGVQAKVKSLDPIMTGGDYYGNEMAGFTYEALLQYHYLKRPYQLVPNLAADMPKFSADGKTITFKVIPGVRFQDDPCFKATNGKGREVTSADFAYALRRLADPANASPGWWLFDGKIAGLNEWAEEAKKANKADYDKPVEGLQTPDPQTLVIKLTKRSYQILYALSMSYTSATAREAVEFYGKDFGRSPVGTGPYMMVRDQSDLGSKFVWVRNPNFRGEKYPSEGEPEDKANGLLDDAGKAMPFVDKFVVTVFVESQPAWLNFMKGELDASGIPKDNYAQAVNPDKTINKSLAEKGIKLRMSPSLDLTYHGFNVEDPILKNKKVRQAISMGTNWAQSIDLFYNGRAIRAQTPIPPGLGGYDEKYVNPYSEYSVEKAKKLLAEAGYPEGKGLPELTYTTPNSSVDRQFFEAMSKEMDALGIKVVHKPLTWPEFQSAVKNKKVQIFGMAWSADYPDAENFLQLFYGKFVSPGENSSNYKNPEFDKMYEKALTLPDGAERSALYHKMAVLVGEDRPLDLGVHRLAFGLIHPWVKNSKPHEFGHTRFKYLRVDPQLRVETKKKY